jgi:hypothetical protein
MRHRLCRKAAPLFRLRNELGVEQLAALPDHFVFGF